MVLLMLRLATTSQQLQQFQQVKFLFNGKQN